MRAAAPARDPRTASNRVDRDRVDLDRVDLDRVAVAFDDEHAVADAGLVLPGVLLARLDAEQTADRLISVGHRPGRKTLTVLAALLAGGDCIDDCDVLRCGATQRVLGHDVMAPSTIGTWLRSFTFGHVRQLDRLAEVLLTRAWAAGAGPGEAPLVIDVDSTVIEVHGHHKQGAAYGYTKQLGYHPVLATRADTGETLHVRMRAGNANTGRGAQRFIRETIGRARRAGATGPITLRADCGFWSAKVIQACRDHQVRFSITVRQTKPVTTAITAIPDEAWAPIDYTTGGQAQVAETTLASTAGPVRLIVRRTRITNGDAVDPAANRHPKHDEHGWRFHAFVTDQDGDAVTLDAAHREHAVVELAIRDLKEGAGLRHCPSGRFFANAAWAVLATIAHNVLRWTAALGLAHNGPVVAKTIRRRLLSLPGRLTRSARRATLHLPVAWPWQHAFLAALSRLRALPDLPACTVLPC